MFRHRFDPSSLVAAALFLGISARYLVHGLGGPRLPFLWTVPAVVTALVLLSAIRLAFRSRRREP